MSSVTSARARSSGIWPIDGIYRQASFGATFAREQGAAAIPIDGAGEIQRFRDHPELSGSSGRGFILRYHAGRDAPAGADRDALLCGPRPDVAAALPGRRRTRAALSLASLAGVLDEGCQLLAERAGVLLVQVDLIRRAAHGEPHGLLGRA